MCVLKVLNPFQILGKTGLWICAVIYFCHGESDYCRARSASELWDGISVLILLTTKKKTWATFADHWLQPCDLVQRQDTLMGLKEPELIIHLLCSLSVSSYSLIKISSQSPFIRTLLILRFSVSVPWSKPRSWVWFTLDKSIWQMCKCRCTPAESGFIMQA